MIEKQMLKGATPLKQNQGTNVRQQNIFICVAIKMRLYQNSFMNTENWLYKKISIRDTNKKEAISTFEIASF